MRDRLQTYAFTTLLPCRGALAIEAGNDYTLLSSFPERETDMSHASPVFADYDVVAPEYRWDDYKNVDVKGKVVILLFISATGDGAGRTISASSGSAIQA